MQEILFSIISLKSLVTFIFAWQLIGSYYRYQSDKEIQKQFKDINRRIDLAFGEIEKNN